MNTNVFKQEKLQELGDEAKTIIQNFLNLNNIPYTYIEYEGHQFAIQVQTENNKMVSLIISVEPDKLSYGFNAIMSYCSKSMVPTTNLLLNEINANLRYGSFCYDSDEEVIVYHYCIPYIDPVFSMADFAVTFEVAYNAIELYVDKIRDITDADFSPDEKELLSKEIKQLFSILIR